MIIGDAEIIQAFLDRGANPRIAKGENYGPLRLAAQLGNVAALKVLLDAGVPVDEESPTRDTALMEAVEHDRVAAVQYLRSRGADVERPQRLEPPLIRACRMQHWKVAGELIAAGANVYARDRDRWTPLHWAARRQNLPTLQLLVAKRAKPDPGDGGGQTPLMWASLYGNASVVRWLLAHGADSTLLDPRKHSALDLARHYRRPDVERLLEAARGERHMARN